MDEMERIIKGEDLNSISPPAIAFLFPSTPSILISISKRSICKQVELSILSQFIIFFMLRQSINYVFITTTSCLYYSLCPKLYVTLEKKIVPNYMSLYNINAKLMLLFLL